MRNKKGKILISGKLLQKMHLQYKEIWDGDDTIAVCFLLGKDKKNIIKDMVRLERSGGCEYMPDVDRKDLSNKYLTLIKMKLNPCGLFRIGPSHFGKSLHYIGISLYELCYENPKAFIITMNDEGFYVERIAESCIKNTKQIKKNCLLFKKTDCNGCLLDWCIEVFDDLEQHIEIEDIPYKFI